MAYEKQEWKDGEEGGTPLSAKRLNHIEDGIAEKAKQGPEGDPGKDLKFDDLTKKQKEELKGKQGDPGKDLKFDDLSDDQKKELKGQQGDPGGSGDDGRGIEDIERNGNTLVFKMTKGDDIEVDLPGDEE